MYFVNIFDTKKNKFVGPSIFTGEGSRYPDLASARKELARWISNQPNKEDLQLNSRIVGCL